MNNSTSSRSGSAGHLPAGARYLGPHEPNASMDLTLVLRRRTPLATLPAAATTPEARLAELAQRHGADPADMQRIQAFAHSHGLKELTCEPERRAMRVRGSAQAIQQAFGVQLGRYELSSGGESFVASAEPPVMPDPALIAVLGLDLRPVARPHFRVARAQSSMSFTPLQLGRLYNFPAGTDGSGQTIAIIELGGGYRHSELHTYFKGLGLTTPSVTAVSIDGGRNAPGGAADGEVLLDIEVSGALAPAATLVVYFAPNTDQGFYNAISQAAHSTSHPATVMSISWGGPEDQWVASSRDAMETALQDAAALGVTVAVACGDSGFTDGESDGQPHVDYPSSSPSVLACGGTKLLASGDAIGSEVVWNQTASNGGATGGGVSTVFARPAWQAHSKVPVAANGFVGRGVPDVSGDADPQTGYQVLVDGQNLVYGGTSAVAPLWAALVARLNQHLGHDVGAANAAFYAIGSAAFRDITSGDNGDYKARKGWDACTGLGSPNGTALLAALTNPAASGGTSS